MAESDAHINFDSPATLRKWPSLNNERLQEGRSAYLVFEGTLDECIKEYKAKHESSTSSSQTTGANTKSKGSDASGQGGSGPGSDQGGTMSNNKGATSNTK